MDNEVADMILEAAKRLLQDKAGLQDLVLAKSDAWKAPLWQGLEEQGLTWAAVSEEHGGADVGLAGALTMLRAAGNVALAAPLAETILANWALSQAGLEPQEGMLAFGPSGFDDRLDLAADGTISGHLARLPFARDAASAVLLVQSPSGLQIAVLDLADAEIRKVENYAGDPTDLVRLNRVTPKAIAAAPSGFSAQTTLLVGSAARSVQIAGALEEILRLTATYVQERPAFSKTLSKFQAVQHALAQMAGEVSVALSSAASAAETLGTIGDFDDPELLLEVMAAKIRISDAARHTARIAHQLHGAIGVTDEHVLHRLTMRALAWRDDYGNDSEWADRLGQLVAKGDGSALWALLSRR